MPKNSTIPLIMFGIILLSMPLFIHSRDSQGYNGPVLFTGIYRGQEGRMIASLSQEALHISNSVQAVDALLGHEQFDNFSQGLEGPYWHNALIYAEDDHPITRSTVKGMAELLTGALNDDVRGMPMQFYLVSVQPHGKTLRPWGVNRIIRVATQKADSHPEKAGDEFKSSVSIAIQDPRIPDLSASLLPLSAGGVQEMGLVVEHSSKGTGETEEELNWANWHASIGRSIAADALRFYWNGEREEMDWQMLDHDTEFGAWRAWKDKDENKEQAFGEKTLLPVHPDHKNVAWYAGFQEPLARGWYGSIVGTKRMSKLGTVRETVAEWDKHISGSGSWKKHDTMNEDLLLWKTIAPDPNRLSSIVTQRKTYGGDVLTWMSDARAEEMYTAWIAQAAAGDYLARSLVRRYVLTAHIDEALRLQGIACLRQNAGLADNAIIGLHPAATAEEKHVAQVVAYVRGHSDDAAAATTVQETNFAELSWDTEPLLLRSADAIAVLLYQRKIKDEQPVRIQAWYRTLEPGAKPQRSEFRNDRIVVGQQQLVLTLLDDGRYQVKLP